MAAPERSDKGPIDPRGLRFGAAITTVVLSLVVLLGPGSQLAGAGLAIQTVFFAFGAVIGLHHHPYGWVFRRFVRPSLGPPAQLENPAPPQFAQAVGLVFALVGSLGWLLGAASVFYVAVGFALAAAFLNAVFGVCLGCEVYLLIARNRPGAFSHTIASRTPVWAPNQPSTTSQPLHVNVTTTNRSGKQELL